MVDLSVIIPAFNEEKRLPATLEEIFGYLSAKNISAEVIVVDDGSTDRTAQVVEAFALRKNSQIVTVSVMSLPKNMGKGYAVKSGVMASSGALVLFCDADGSTPFAEIERLRIFIDLGFHFVIGSRALQSQDTQVKKRFYRMILGRTFNLLINLLVVPNIRDTQCGFKLFTKDAAHFLFSLLKCQRFGFDMELLFLARKIKMPVKEVAINWHHVHGSKVNLLRDATKMIVDSLRFSYWHSGVTPANWENFRQRHR